MAEAKKAQASYGNESISALKGADRVRKRPGVIFGSDGLEGCEHAVFEILSNAIDEAREGHGSLITVTRYLDHSPSRWRTRAGAARWTGTRRRSGTTGSWCSASSTPAASTATTRGRTTSTPWGSTAWAPAPPSTPPPTWTSPSGGTGTSTSSTSKRASGQEGQELQKEPPSAEKDRHQDPLAAGPGGLHRHRHPGGLLHRRAQAPGGGQRRGHLPLPGGDRPGEVRDHRFLI